jgi:hypothetical protein
MMPNSWNDALDFLRDELTFQVVSEDYIFSFETEKAAVYFWAYIKGRFFQVEIIGSIFSSTNFNMV